MYQGSLAIAGEFLGTRRFSMRDEPEFLAMLKILREADTTYCHLEMNFTRKDAVPGRPAGVGGLRADPVMAHELKWAGIDLVSCAFNHSMDWGADSIMGTIEALDNADIVHAGTGSNLEEAREPAYFESKGGRVAIISMSSGHHPYDVATLTKAPVRGKPGLNPLRIIQKYVLTPEDLEKLEEIWNKLGLILRRSGDDVSRDFPSMAGVLANTEGEAGDILLVAGDFGGGDIAKLYFRSGDKTGILSIPNKWDLEGNLRAIRDARKQADLVIVAHHVAVTEGGGRTDTPCKFVPPFARQCIDEGADVYVAHGWHRLLGIEFYKGKPIWHGTGNFWAGGYGERLPSGVYEAHGFRPDELAKLVPSDVSDHSAKLMTNFHDQPGAMMVTLDMEGGKFKRMKLYPLSMGHEYGKGAVRKTGNKIEGRPMLTHGENAKKVIDHVTKLSEPFNTHIEYKDGIGVIEIK